ncbi:MAG: signal recognition particle-docking protein FtsY [Candidatus Eisenbacteria bacterium]
MGFFEKISQGLKRTRDAIAGQVAAVFQPGRSLTEADYDALETALLRADVGPQATDRLLASVRATLKDSGYKGTPAEALRSAVELLLADATRAAASRAAIDLASPSDPAPRSTPKPLVTLVVGVNGTGKTTTIAKLANHHRKLGQTVLLVACDTFRAAAANQLEVWAKRAGVEIHRQAEGADPASVAFDGIARAKARGADRVYVDTAGRLHVKANLMAELEKIRRVIGKAAPGAPHETLLVLDATTGQNGLAQAREFDKALALSGLALTKLDGTAKGGVVLAIAETLNLPILWVGVGEGMDDLIPFDPAEYARGLVGAP